MGEEKGVLCFVGDDCKLLVAPVESSVKTVC